MRRAFLILDRIGHALCKVAGEALIEGKALF
jgi:hypothetical protein